MRVGDTPFKEYLPNELPIRDSTNTVRPKSGDDLEVFRWDLEAFLTEARTIAKFRHPNVMRVRRFFEGNGTGYFVVDFEAGESPDQWVKERTVTEGDLRGLMLSLLDGLTVVHEAGVLHRDIKLSNIIVRRDGSPVLIDFGAAQGLPDAAESGKAPPEAVLGLRDDPMMPAAEAGSRYEGAERGNKQEGYRVLTSPSDNWRVYRGEFHSNNFNGYAVVTLARGATYYGRVSPNSEGVFLMAKVCSWSLTGRYLPAYGATAT
jgi:serine/threonine protein kinase